MVDLDVWVYVVLWLSRYTPSYPPHNIASSFLDGDLPTGQYWCHFSAQLTIQDNLVWLPRPLFLNNRLTKEFDSMITTYREGNYPNTPFSYDMSAHRDGIYTQYN